MPVLTSERREKKQGKIRNSEYYGMESIFDTLYAESRNGKTFNHLMAIIESEENIKLAYRTIKRNHGSKTPGVDKKTIRNLAKLSEDEYVRLVKKKFSNYHPRPVRREEIPKDNGKTRPLGIPAISDRIVQQCILQVMEPICEAKFSENSNGFRPNRSAETAIAQCCRLIQVQHLYHVVDLDIKGFFDNINHTKLIRQIWSLGIRDKKLLCIIKQMLKASVILPNGEKIYPTKGTPQGGILSPLLANIVLNELDWWIASQWENMPTRTEFTIRQNRSGAEIKSHVYRALRRSNLKEMHSVRYADDFKIFCSSHEDAVKAYHATAKWLKDRLGLDVSPEKSRIVNLKRQYSEFLGFKLKVQKRSNKYVVKSHMCDKAYKKVQKKLTEEVKKLEHSADDKAQFMQLMTYNAVVAGIHQYYCIATAVSEDFGKLAYGAKKQMLTERNNLHDVDTWMFFKYFVKMWIAVYLVSHTFDIAMAVFDIGQSVVNSSSGIIRGNTAIDISSLSMQMQAAMATMAIGELVTLALETLVVSWCLKILSVVITVIMYGRMIEIYRASRSAAFHPKAVCGHFGNPALASR